jgi:restriction system protein
MKTEQSQLSVTYSQRGIPSYSLEIWHNGLNKHRLIKGGDASVVALKAALQSTDWDQKWETVSVRDEQRRERESKKSQLDDNKAEALSRTEEAVEELSLIRNLLKHTLSVNDAIDWERLKNTDPFPELPPEPPQQIRPPHSESAPREPLATDTVFQPSVGLLAFFIPSLRRRAIEEASQRFDQLHQKWQVEASEHAAREADRQRLHDGAVAAGNERYKKAVDDWMVRKADFLKRQQDDNDAVEAQRLAYLAGKQESIMEYCDMVLSESDYPSCFPQEYELDYNPDTKTLIVNYNLPAPEDMPTVKAVKYVASRDEFEEQYLTEAQANKQYDDALYQVCLRTLHELFEADVINVLDAIVFNGIVNSIDRRTGKSVTACVLSVQALHNEFMDINLEQVDPKACFKSLKGIGSSKLHGLAAVPPVMVMNRDDARFVPSHAIADDLDYSSNLAAIGWEDFEHLIRELFEKEFTSTGGEVKVTQASRDGGVDAIAFDPDPIRGGKIVIQAKRYTNTVGVSAVRDLYGTVMNEGANKGILVTTSDYGPDSYSFAKGKPLQLLNGANLLSLLQKHGYKAHINLQQARKIGTTD